MGCISGNKIINYIYNDVTESGWAAVLGGAGVGGSREDRAL